MLTYFVGLGFAINEIHGIDSAYKATALCGLFSYIGAPVAVTIGFYINKAKAKQIKAIEYNVNSAFTSEEYVKEECDDENRY